jgi:hypothetical protein
MPEGGDKGESGTPAGAVGIPGASEPGSVTFGRAASGERCAASAELCMGEGERDAYVFDEPEGE